METVSGGRASDESTATLMLDYTLIWDQRFVQPLQEFEPMNYTAPPPIRVAEVKQEHLNEVSCINRTVAHARTSSTTSWWARGSARDV
jgi:hypothetical protein